MQTIKEPLYGKTLAQLEAICGENGLPKFTAKQIANWLYVKRVSSIEQMTNLALKAREQLAESYVVGLYAPLKVSEAKDGTKKYLFATSRGHFVEAAYIPSADRATLCVSSQAGCRMGCTFCATGRQGLQHSLSAGEILNQVASIEESEKLTNIVFMGMGEPLDNTDNVLAALEVMTAKWGYAWSPSRITLSTAGVTRELRRFLDSTSVHLAVSLHNPYHDERAEIMPIENAYPIAEIIEVLREYDFSHQRRVSFEYIVMSGKNNHPHHIREICRLLNGVKCRINLIKFHKIPGSPYFSPDDEKMERFRDTLTAKGIHTTIRTSRGEDIQAACGLLSTSESSNS
ncbi:MAG: 23S rRNA (adenine(2503)-C(2))-methyltransferase RlmN [Rikenellaceae bacterium]